MVSAGESTSGAAETRVPQVFPGSLYGGRWADGPRVKPELVGLASELRRAGVVVDALDLEVECGNPDDDASRETFLARSHELLAAALRGAARASTPSSPVSRGLRSHETVGSAAAGVPHGWWVEGRWH